MFAPLSSKAPAPLSVIPPAPEIGPERVNRLAGLEIRIDAVELSAIGAAITWLPL